MAPNLEDKHIASYDAKGGFWVEPAIEWLRRANADCVAGRAPDRFAIGIFDGMVEAIRFNKVIRRMRKEKAAESPAPENVGSTFSGGC